MNRPAQGSFDEELPIFRANGSSAFTLRHPRQPCIDPSLLLNLAKDRKSALSESPYCITSDLFVAAGHYAASFDLPNHGDNIDEFGEGLEGMAAAIAAGVDVFAAIHSTSQYVLNICGDLKITEPNRILVTGTSRGGLAALHVMAAFPHIAGAAVFAPVTMLPFLCEFAGLAESPIIRTCNAEALIPRLRGRPVMVSIGPDDRRVGTAQCQQFHAHLSSGAEPDPAVLHMDTEAIGHRASEAAYRLGALFLLKQIRKE